MINKKELDRADIWIASDPLTPEAQKRFSEFLKSRRDKQERASSRRLAPLHKKNGKAVTK